MRTPSRAYDYYACDRTALHATKKYLVSRGYEKVRTVAAIEPEYLNEVISVLQKKVSVCDVVCDIVKTGLERQAI